MFRYTLSIAYIIFMIVGFDHEHLNRSLLLLSPALIILITGLVRKLMGKPYLVEPAFVMLFSEVQYQKLFAWSAPPTLLFCYLLYDLPAVTSYKNYWPLFALAFTLPVMLNCIRLSYRKYCSERLSVPTYAEQSGYPSTPPQPLAPNYHAWTTTPEAIIAEAHAKRLTDIHRRLALRAERKVNRAKSDELLSDALMYTKLLETYVNSSECDLKGVFADNYNWLPGDHSPYKIPVPSLGSPVLSIRPVANTIVLETSNAFYGLQLRFTFYPDDRLTFVEHRLAVQYIEEASQWGEFFTDVFSEAEYLKVLQLLKDMEIDSVISNSSEIFFKPNFITLGLPTELTGICSGNGIIVSPSWFNVALTDNDISVEELRTADRTGQFHFNEDEDGIVECVVETDIGLLVLATTRVTSKDYTLEALEQLAFLHFIFYYQQLRYLLTAVSRYKQVGGRLGNQWQLTPSVIEFLRSYRKNGSGIYRDVDAKMVYEVILFDDGRRVAHLPPKPDLARCLPIFKANNIAEPEQY